jgi:hypothetical protein
VEVHSLSYGAYVTLGKVIEHADDYVRRRSAELLGDEVEPDAVQLRFAEAVRWLGRRLTGMSIRVRFFERDPTDDGLLEDALTDVEARILSFNVRGPLRFDDPVEPQTLGVILHELAHLETAEHDHRFIERLGRLAGAAARLLGEGGNHTLALAGYGNIALPRATAGTSRPIIQLTDPGDAVTLASNTVFSGFIIDSPDGHGIVADGVSSRALAGVRTSIAVMSPRCLPRNECHG